MPNIPTHIHLALDVSSNLKEHLETESLGSFLLGSTSPDIRAITKTQRGYTHFAPLDSLSITEGVEKLLSTYPELQDSNRISKPTKAFIAGYICHLVADQTWIIEIFKPYFGNRSLFANQAQANVLDRALQLELDNQCKSLVQNVCGSLEDSDFGVEVAFINNETLREWRDWVIKFCMSEFSWERLKFMALRQERTNHEIASRVANEFIQNVPVGLQFITERLPWCKIVTYHQSVVAKGTQMVQEYLNENHPGI